jgi:hypothetical protein
VKLRSQTAFFEQMVVWTIGGCLIGFIVSYAVCILWLVPGWAEKNPHDGQLGLAAMMISLFGSVVGAVVGYIVRRILNDNVSYD